jgi:ubiquinone/menaquinone biosynthesis C-methylase UbiE
MEGAVARWYTGIRGTPSQLEQYRRQAVQLTDGLPAGANILEVAPGPGFLAIEMAGLGRFQVSGLDISHTFVAIGIDNARKAGVSVEFQQGDASAMPFEAATFDRIVCQAAFKNFVRPVTALNEMHRVLREGGTAVIQDMNHDASHDDIELEVRTMKLGWFPSFTTKTTLEMLRRRAYSPARFEALVEDSEFRTCEIRTEGIGFEVRLSKS